MKALTDRASLPLLLDARRRRTQGASGRQRRACDLSLESASAWHRSRSSRKLARSLSVDSVIVAKVTPSCRCLVGVLAAEMSTHLESASAGTMEHPQACSINNYKLSWRLRCKGDSLRH